MKKMMFMALVAAACTFASCWNENKTEEGQKPETDGVVITDKEDTTKTVVNEEEGDEAAKTSKDVKEDKAEKPAEDVQTPAEGADAPAQDAATAK